ncbi:MAG: alcohol dehydrogenase [Rhodoglobus sp.]|nr:alcohol dehydrogenase [Rhodoglobus sp.]
MWAYRVSDPGKLEKIEIDAPSQDALAPGEVIIKLLAAGICGSDIPKFFGRVNPVDPHIGFPLHELCGEVVASQDPNLKPGMRVVGMALNSNGFSEYVANPGHMLRPIESDMSSAVVTMIQPAATVMNALANVPDPRGKRVAVIGQGPLGILFSHIMKWRGAAHVTGVDRVDRSDVASIFGVDEAVWRSSDRWARELAQADRPEIVIEAVGHQPSTLSDAIEACAQDGHIFGFGVPDDTHYAIPFQRLFRKGLSLTGGVTSEYQRFLAEAQEYVEANPAAQAAYVTTTVPFADAQDAFEIYARPTAGRLKVVLTA